MAPPPPVIRFVVSAVNDGKKLIVPRLGGLPANCVKCGASAERPWKRSFRWHAPWLYFLILFPGILVYAIVALVVQKKMSLNVPLCEVHHGERKRYLLIGATLCLVSIPGAMLLNSFLKISDEAAVGVGIMTMVAGLVFLIISGRSLHPTLIDGTHGEFTGACRAFLSLLPPKFNP